MRTRRDVNKLLTAVVSLVVLAGVMALAETSLEQTIRDLASPDTGVRLRAARRLKETAPLDAAVPLANLIADPNPEIQLEAIAGELNIFLAEKVVPRRRVGLVVEVRDRISAEAIFDAGPFVLGPALVPAEVPNALRTAVHAQAPAVAIEALYAFGALARESGSSAVLRSAAPDLASLIGVSNPEVRLAAVRVIGRAFARQGADVLDEPLGDAVVSALNDRSVDIRLAAMKALGELRYARAVGALTQLVEYYGDSSAAEPALDATAHIAYTSSAPLFASQLRSKTATSRLRAIEGLARLGDPAHLTEIQEALGNEKNDTLLLAGHFANAMLSNGSLDILIEELRRSKLRDQAFEYLSELAPGRTASFAGAAQGSDTRLRTDVANILGLSGDRAALALVEPMAKDPDSQVARAAERAARRLRQTTPAS